MNNEPQAPESQTARGNLIALGGEEIPTALRGKIENDLRSPGVAMVSVITGGSCIRVAFCAPGDRNAGAVTR